MTISECAADSDFVVWEASLASEEECRDMCTAFYFLEGFTCQFSKWQPGEVANCQLYREDFSR